MGFLIHVPSSHPSIVKSREDGVLKELSKSLKPVSYAHDPRRLREMDRGEQVSKTHPGTLGLSYDACDQLGRVPVIGAMVGLRTNQGSDFSQPLPDPFSIGFVIEHRHKSKDRGINNRDEKRIRLISDVVRRAGGPYWPGGFDSFLRTIIPDSLHYDQCNFEVIRDRGGKPWGFVPVDPKTFRRARPSESDIDSGRTNPSATSYVQCVDDKIVGEYDYEELAWGIRRPRSDIRVFGYGYPELEQLIGTITNYLNADTFNAAKFNNGISPRMIVGVKSTLSQDMFRALESQIWAMLNGVQQHGRVPIIQLDPEMKEDISAIHLNSDTAEMEYSNWINQLLKIICGVFQIDPAEIGFVFGNEGQGSGLQNSSAADRVIMSREKGLRPLMRHIEYWLNEWVIHPFDDDYSLRFVGFDTETEAKRYELDEVAIQNFDTVDEVRKRQGKDSDPNGLGHLILNPTYVQYLQAKEDREREEEEALDEFDAYMEDPEGFAVDESVAQQQEAMLGGGDTGGEMLAASLGRPGIEASKGGEVDALLKLEGASSKLYRRNLRTLLRNLKKKRRG